MVRHWPLPTASILWDRSKSMPGYEHCMVTRYGMPCNAYTYIALTSMPSHTAFAYNFTGAHHALLAPATYPLPSAAAVQAG
jgi:hypothetical protein